MMWQHDVRLIVMLTAEREGGMVKAHNYWESKRYGALQVDALSEHRASLASVKGQRRKQRPAHSRQRSSNAVPKKN